MTVSVVFAGQDKEISFVRSSAGPETFPEDGRTLTMILLFETDRTLA